MAEMSEPAEAHDSGTIQAILKDLPLPSAKVYMDLWAAS
jgi:hypothetical protein